MVRRRTPTKRITAASSRRSSTLSSMMQSRKTALATMVMTAMARWNRLTTLKVWDDSEAISAEGYARNPKALRLSSAAAESGEMPGASASPKRSTRSGAPSSVGEIGQVEAGLQRAPRDLRGVGTGLVDRAHHAEAEQRIRRGAQTDGVAHTETQARGRCSAPARDPLPGPARRAGRGR